MKQNISENSYAPPMHHHGFEIARRVYDIRKYVIVLPFLVMRISDVSHIKTRNACL